MQQTALLLRSVWETPLWRDEILATFERWVLDGASRSDAKRNVKILIETDLEKNDGRHARNIILKQINWDQLTEFLCTCYYRNRLRSPIPGIPSDDMWEKITGEQPWGLLSHHPQQDKAIKDTVPVPLFPLEQRLLESGGIRMVYRFEPDLKKLLERGEIFDGPVELFPAQLGQCHANVAHLWNENREGLAIVTGYALSEDGLWRQHSWLIRKNTTPVQCQVVETTTGRVKYFGVVLTASEAKIFSQNNR